MAKTNEHRRITEGMTKKQRQEFARELARIERERRARARRQQRILGWTLGAIVVAAGLGLGGWLTYSALTAPRLGPANLASDGLLLQGSGDGSTTAPVMSAALALDAVPVPNEFDAGSSGELDVEAYLDPTSVDTAKFWSTNGSSIESYLAAGSLELELHVVAADPKDADAIAAASAFACVANGDPDSAQAFWDAMEQVSVAGLETGVMVDRDGLDGAATTAGVTDKATLSCIDDEGYKDWAVAESERAQHPVPYAPDGAGASSIPYVVSAGSVYTGAGEDATAFTTFLGNAAAAAITPTPTPTPTP